MCALRTKPYPGLTERNMSNFDPIKCADTTGYTSAQKKSTFMKLGIALCHKTATHSYCKPTVVNLKQ